jgi:23S rRNA pseudouridine1911/1915/1917 synthase
MNFPILFEDEAMIAVNKPPGIVVNRAESVKGETVQDWVEKTYQIFIDNRAGIVHRIDKETSGILLIAKTPTAFIELQRQFKERVIHKTYLAIVHGTLVPDTGEIRAPVARLPWNRERFGIVPGGKESVTKYKVVQHFERAKGKLSEKYSFVELYPETGRTHQIRVHLKYINHPIVGDYLYAGRKTARDDRTWAPRVMLHAWKLVCTHPVTKNELAIEAPIPDDMNIIIHGRA